ncbi:hypothetical protein DKT69_21310 [Micromonospora sicca]|uniref:Uncharacterized protein n=1 Tax=Micromonospora sicca TaxID=2202420 RepID=A0A317DEY4_9ACTN|nr:hypothetical protein DKT69_21310 [Micromonospora sp. 4G51]
MGSSVRGSASGSVQDSTRHRYRSDYTANYRLLLIRSFSCLTFKNSDRSSTEAIDQLRRDHWVAQER